MWEPDSSDNLQREIFSPPKGGFRPLLSDLSFGAAFLSSLAIEGV